ncbi:MAG: toxin-antitoxin system HicB family antitoxin [Verrucomicrobiales bacterium]|nr:toxin-antitoxin system HicB family antitoxin [Verrucomicrobiales bacterium]
MNALTIRLPDSVHQTIKRLAKRDGCSVNQFLASAAVEKMSALLTLDHLREEAGKATRADFEAFLKSVPDAEPTASDQL